MFKDLYKKANDKIPTEDAYLRVMENINTKAQKPKYSYIKVAALAACFLLTFSMISLYENFAPKEEIPFEIITPENLPTETPIVAKAIPQTEKKPTEEPSYENAETTAYEVLESQEPIVEIESENVSLSEPQSSLSKNQGIPENVGISVARFTLGDTVTRDTYYEYLGKNIEDLVVLPEGFSNETPNEHMLCLDESENFDDRWTFYFTKGDSSIFITTTKKTENIINILNNEDYLKNDISGTLVVLFEEELQKIAVFEMGGISYTISSYGVSDEDFENLIVSLLK